MVDFSKLKAGDKVISKHYLGHSRKEGDIIIVDRIEMYFNELALYYHNDSCASTDPSTWDYYNVKPKRNLPNWF